MKLLALTIMRLEGLRTGFVLRPEHLTGRVRVLHGPNAIGKSSVLRALKFLLWPRETPASGSLELEARFEVGGVEWTARREGSGTRWTRDGNEVNAPPLPPWRHASQMLVGLDALGLGGEKDVEEHVQREFGGGYDLAGVEASMRPGTQIGRTQARALSDAEDALRKARHEQDEIVRDAERLAEVRAERDAAVCAQRRVALLDRALELAAAKRKLAEVQTRLAEFPSGLDRWRGSEPEELESLRSRLAKSKRDQELAHRAVAELERKISGSGLAEPLTSTVLDGIGDRVDGLREAEEELQSAREAASGADARLRAAASVFGANADLDRFAGLDATLDEEVEQLVRAAEAHTRIVGELEAQIAALGESAQVQPPQPRAAAALEDWLAAPTEAKADGRSRWTLYVLALVLAFTAVGLAFVHAGFLGLLALSVLALFGARGAMANTGPSRATHAAAYAQTSEAAPTDWNAVAVRKRLTELRQLEVRALEARGREERRGELAARLASHTNEGRKIAQTRLELAARLGASVAAPDGALAAFAQSRRALREARSTAAECSAAHDRCEARRTEVLAALNEELERCGAMRVGDFTAAKVRIKHLRERSAELAALRVERDGQREVERNARESAKQIEKEITAVFLRGDLEPGDDASLAHRLEGLGAWKSALKVRDEAAHDVQRSAGELAAKSGGVSDGELADAPQQQLEAERTAALEIAAGADSLTERVVEIQTLLARAREERTLETALEQRDARHDALKDVFARARRGELACALLADVRAAHETTSRPRVVEEAEKLFVSFTHGRYSLRVTTVDGRIVFTALDTHNAVRPFRLDELSDGTRAQLLLASRLAYLRTIERGDPLPLVLDDALATSDPARKQQVGAALLEVARTEDRQILVMTPDAGDVELLRPKDAAPGDVEATDLAALRGGEMPVAARARLALPSVTPVPEVGRASPGAYAHALEAAGMPVRPFDPRREIDEVHLWWVLHHDLELLHRLLDLHFENVASFRNAAHHRIAGLGARESDAAAPWIALASAVIDAWRIGRGRPIDRDALLRAGVSDTFIDRMVELAANVRGDAKAWLVTVSDGSDERAKGYRKKSLDQNRELLEQNGYLDPREILDREAAWMRVLASLPPNHELGATDVRARFELLWRSCEERGDEVVPVAHPRSG